MGILIGWYLSKKIFIKNDEINRKFDERRDPIKSAMAAAKMIKDKRNEDA